MSIESGSNDQIKDIVTLRLEKDLKDDMDSFVEQSDQYDNRTEFVIDSIKYLADQKKIQPDYEEMLNAARDVRDYWDNQTKTDLTSYQRDCLGEHIGKLEILEGLEDEIF